MLLLSISTTFACGPFEDSAIDNPIRFHFYHQSWPTLADVQRKQNIKLWQGLTSDSVSAEDINSAVYSSSLSELEAQFNAQTSNNELVNWITAHNNTELKEFLLLAKKLEELRGYRSSAWYYPTSKSGFDETIQEEKQYETIITACHEHQHGRLADRYALQAVRALRAIGEYQRCIDFYNKHLSAIPDNNLFKQMAKGYVAGCWLKLGETDLANKMFAEVDDFNSISGKDMFLIMARNNPESNFFKARLNECIGYGDSTQNVGYIKIADTALSSSKVIHRGDWLFMKAFIETIYCKDFKKALSYIRQARNKSFSNESMKNDAKILEICLRAQLGDISSYQADAKWLIDQGEMNVIYFYLIPAMLQQNLLSEALLIGNYGTACDTSDINIDNEHCNTYSNTGFQMLLSVKADDIVAYQKMLTNPKSDFVKSLKENVRHDEDYLNEIIGTLYLREGNYTQAADYLSKVSLHYQLSMNIYPYLAYNPWVYCYTPVNKWSYYISNPEYDDKLRPTVDKYKTTKMLIPINAKLNFARAMTLLQHRIKTAKDSDEKALLQLRYCIGRYNSFNTCWALTQYWLGNAQQCNYALFFCQQGEFHELNYIIDTPLQLSGIDQWFESQIELIFRSLKSEEALAQAHYILRNYRTIARHYPDTSAGEFLQTHCDNWEHWL